MEDKLIFPLASSSFVRKRDANYDGDPNGDYVQAEDVNELQEAIERVEDAIGMEDLGKPISEELRNKADKEDVTEFGVPFFINYNGASISAYDTIEERINAFSYIPHVVLKKETSTTFDFFIQEVKRSGTSLYGHVSYGLNEVNVVESEIDWFIGKGFDGILLSDFDFENGLTRAKQNQILDYVHKQNRIAILTSDIDTTLFNKIHANNPLQESLRLNSGDIYLAKNVFVSDGAKVDSSLIVNKAFQLNKAQKETGVKIFVEDTADYSSESNSLYLYGKLLSTLYNLDGYSLAPKSRFSLNDKINRYISGFELGAWKATSPIYVENASFTSRVFSRGSIVFNKVANEVAVEGVGLSPNIYEWEDKQIPGRAIDLINADYNDEVVNTIVDAINDNDHLIHFSKIDGLNEGGVTPELIKDTVVRAINNSPAAKAKNPPDGYDKVAGDKFIHGGIIDYIDASAIKSGVLSIDRIKTNIIEAINAYIGTAKINNAFIGELSADHIAVNVVDAINIYASNASINKAVINQSVIGELTSNHIKTAVIDAVNASIGTAVIDSAKIGQLKAGHITATVIEAINASIEEAVIDSARIGTLTASHIKGTVVEAINLYAGNAKINAAQIGALKAENISAGLIEALEISASKAEFDSLKAAVIDAINASIENAFIDGAIIDKGTIGNVQIADGSITDAKIVSLVANKIAAGTIDTGQVTLQGDNGHLRITGNRLQVFDDQATPIERVSVGDVNGDGSLFGLRVRGEDGKTVLYDESGVYSEGITDGAITNPKIAQGAVDGEKHIAANTITGDKMVADSVTTRELAARSVTANEMQIGTLVAGSGIIGKGAIGEAEIAELSVTSAKVKEMSVSKLSAGSLEMSSSNILLNSTFKKGFLNWTYDPRFLIAEITPRINHNGMSSMHMMVSGLTSPQNLNIFSDYFVAEEGSTFSSSVYVLTSNLASFDGTQPSVGIEYYDNTNKVLKYEFERSTLTAKNVWQRISVISTAPAGTSTIRFRLTFSKNGDVFYSKPMLQKGHVVTEWVGDGSYLTEDGIYTGDLNANQITAGRIKADLLEIGSGTSYQEGYSPDELREEMENRIPYKVEIISTNGLAFRRGEISTVLKARVYKGAEDITDSLEADRFIWIRVGMDPDEDIVWNDAHEGMKEVSLTNKDVYQRATFLCQILE